MPWHRVSGSAMTSRKASSASCLEDAASPLLNRAEADSEARSTSCFAVTHRQQSRSCCSTFTRLLLEAFTLLERAHLPSALLFMSPKTQRLERLSSKVVLLCFQIEVFAASMNSTKWTRTLESSSMKQWSSKPFQLPKQVSSAR